MSDTHLDPNRHEEFDQEVRLKPIALTLIGLTAVIVVSFVLMWWMSVALKDQAVAGDPTPSPIPEAAEDRLPPGPLLQASPEAELIEMNAEYEALLSSWGWVDENAGIAHIPIERALELVAERGLPSAAALATAGSATTTPSTDGIEQETLDAAGEEGR